MTSSQVDDRIKSLLVEAEAMRDLNDGSGNKDPAFKAWRQRVTAALEDKFGHDARQALEFRNLKFFYDRMIWTDTMPPVTAQQHQQSFARALDDALAILLASVEANPRTPTSPPGPLVHIEQVGNSTTATASAEVRVEITIQQLRQLVASEPGLSPEDRAAAMAAIPDDPGDMNLGKVDELLDVATKAKGLFQPILGWLLTHADKFPWN